MQTFLPYPNFEDSVRTLDNKRLGKQRVEAKQLLDIVEGRTTSWANHPAAKMWMGCPDALKWYLYSCITEWERRGFNNTMAKPFLTSNDTPYPWWLGDDDFHRTHRARLLEKDFNHYHKLFPGDWRFNQGLYIWPVMETQTFEIIIPKKEKNLIDKSRLLNYPTR